MGYQDRDYFRAGSGWNSFLSTTRVCKTLMVINIIAFLVQNALDISTQGEFTRWFAMNPYAVFERGEVWRLVTGAFLHGSIWHLFCNMYALWLFGFDMEDIYGPKEFLAFYLVSAIIANIAFAGGQYFFSDRSSMLHFIMEHHDLDQEELKRLRMMMLSTMGIGASGAVSAVMLLCACHYPYRTLLLFMVIPVPLWLAAVIYVGADSLIFMRGIQTGVAVTAHLGGALFGAVYYFLHWRLTGNWTFGIRQWWRRPKLRLLPHPSADKVRPKAASSQKEAGASPGAQDQGLVAQADAVLAKMACHGKESLTAEEQAILQKASELYKRRRS